MGEGLVESLLDRRRELGRPQESPPRSKKLSGDAADTPRQDPGPDLGERRLDFIGRRPGGGLVPVVVGRRRRERLPIRLAVGRCEGGTRGIRTRREPRPRGLRARRLRRRSARDGRPLTAGSEIRDQPEILRLAARHDRGVDDRGRRPEDRFDLRRVDALSPDLRLEVDPLRGAATFPTGVDRLQIPAPEDPPAFAPVEPPGSGGRSAPGCSSNRAADCGSRSRSRPFHPKEPRAPDPSTRRTTRPAREADGERIILARVGPAIELARMRRRWLRLHSQGEAHRAIAGEVAAKESRSRAGRRRLREVNRADVGL